MRTMADAQSLRDAAPRTPRPRRHPRSVQEVRDRRRRILTWLLSAGLAVLLVNSIVGENGYLATVQSEHEQRRLEADLARTREANAATLSEIRRLRSDADALEEAARRQLNLIKPGETLVIVHPVPQNAPVSK